jgi:signal transduction histidine kinase
MNWRSLVGYRGKSRLAREAGATLFQGLRVRLTLWYCAVLGIALILFGVALYIGTRYSLLNPIASDAAGHAQVHENEWFTGSPEQACPFPAPASQPTLPPGQGFQMPEQVICFDQNGSLLAREDTMGLSAAFLTNTLAKKALRTGKPANDIVDAGSSIGPIYRYALGVPNQQGTGNAGVVVIGESIKAQENTLSSLLMLLLSIGGVALLGAGLGGLFLSHRALAPARLAWANQQRFIADASHELRTPLTLLYADAEVLLRGRERLKVEDAALLQDIVAEAKQMTRISDNLLTLARLDNSVLHREHEVVGLAALAQEGARRVQALAAQRSITIEVEISSDPSIIGDPMLLEQAVLILLDNAIKYNRSGGQVTLSTQVKEKRAILEVRDSGIGIAAEHLLYLGERFYRVDKARSREGGGTGLGLSIARSIVLAHDGEFSLASVPEQGTSVTLTFPLARGEVSGDREERVGSV